MRALRLTRVAAKAEILLLRRLVTVAVRRAILGAVAAVFALAALILLHVIGYLALRQYAQLAPIWAACVVCGVDILIAAVFGLLAGSHPADPIADEARRVRDLSLEQARQSLTLAAMIAPVTRLVADTGLLRLLLKLLGAPFRRKRE